MIRRVAKVKRSISKFYGFGRYNVVKKQRGVGSAMRAQRSQMRHNKKDYERAARGEISGGKEFGRTERRWNRFAKRVGGVKWTGKKLHGAHRTRRQITGSGLVIVGAGGVSYGSRPKKARKRRTIS